MALKKSRNENSLFFLAPPNPGVPGIGQKIIVERGREGLKGLEHVYQPERGRGGFPGPGDPLSDGIDRDPEVSGRLGFGQVQAG